MNYIDCETYNEVPIKHGTYKYTSTCEVMIVTYALGDGPVRVWLPADTFKPPELFAKIADPNELFCAHNSMFDRNALKRIVIDIPIERWRDTMVKALAHGLPGGLDILSDIFKLGDKAKHKDGRRLIQLFCTPRPATSKIRRATRETHPKEWQEFLEYAKADVEAMRELDRKLPEWNYRDAELALWHLDQRINDRGLLVDVGFAEAAIAAVSKEQSRLATRTRAATGGAVGSTTQRDQLLAHIVEAYGIELPDMQMATLERRIADTSLPPELRELLAIRLQATSTSTSKYKSLINGTMPDGRLRGTLQYNGAARTRRWAGRTFQPQNLPRPDMKFKDIEFAIEAVKAGYEYLIFDDVMRVARNGIRSAIIAPPGKKLVIADLANIEGRIGAWLGGEEWKLEAFRAYDRGEGPDLYIVAYAAAFNVDTGRVTKEQRQIGKVMELMLQYEGGVGAFITGAATYGIDLDAMADAVWHTLPGDVVAEAHGMWDWTCDMKRPTFDLSERVFVTCDALKRLWRRRHPGIVAQWSDLKANAIAAIQQPGARFTVGKFILQRDGAWLRIALPSGNYLCYPSPQVDAQDRISYMGMNQYTRKWSRQFTYGGKLFENACQALAGDVLKANLDLVEHHGFEILLTVHDEIITEAPGTKDFIAEGLSAIMSTVPEWADGLPLAAAGFESQRYRKD